MIEFSTFFKWDNATALKVELILLLCTSFSMHLFICFAQIILFVSSVCCHWFPKDETTWKLYTQRSFEDTVYNPPFLFPVAPPAPKATQPALLKKQFFQTDLQPALNFKSVWGNLNIEGNLMRTEAALQGPWLCSLCVVLMSTFVATVAFQIHANRRPVLCVARQRWSPLLTPQQHVAAKHCDVHLPQS